MFIQFALTFDGCSSTEVHKREGVDKAGDKLWTELFKLSTEGCGQVDVIHRVWIMRTKLFKQTGCMKPQESDNERNTKARTGIER
jgi:hypothetical protein